MSHYYINDPKLDHDIKKMDVKIQNIPFVFYTDRGVFSKEKIDFGTLLLCKHVEIDSDHSHIIDLGCGYGVLGIYAAKKYPQSTVTMLDINQRAIDLAQQNIKENKIENASASVSHLFENVKEKADLILTNPPIRAGKTTVFKIYEQAYKMLNVGGVLRVVIQKKQGAPSSLEKLKQLFQNAHIIDRDKGYWILSATKDGK